MKSLSIYSSITTLPLKYYIDHAADDKIYGIVISGTADEKTLRDQWEKILQESAQANNSADYKLYLHVFKTLTDMEITYAQIHALAGEKKVNPDTKEVTQGLLRVIYNEDLCKQLNKLLRTMIVFNPSDPKSYHEALTRCIRRSGSMKIQIDLLRSRFDAIKKKFDKTNSQEGKTAADIRSHYMGMLIELGDHAGYDINDDITVWEYYHRINKYNKSNEFSNRKKTLQRK